MAEPLSREERARVMGFADTEWVCVPVDAIERYEATVQRAEAALRDARDKIEEGMQANNHFDSLEAFAVAHTIIRAYHEEAERG